MLWLALHFPLLPLEALPLRQSPSAVVVRGRILIADHEAAAAGVQAGQKLSTALGLQPGLRLVERDAGREQRVLHDLACWAGSFTPTLSLAPPATLLLEIGGCLRLFGGLPLLLAAVFAASQEQGWTLSPALAPWPLAARWLAQGGAGLAAGAEDGIDMAALLAQPEHWRAALAGLSCSVAGWPADIVARLESFGLPRLGDLARQPSAGLRRRIGNAPVDEWLRACGDLPDPQPAFVFPEIFTAACELPARVEHAESLVFAAQRLLAALAGWLQARQSGVRACSLHLGHEGGATTLLPLRLAEATADEKRLLRLLREHLGRLKLAAPLIALRLQADEVLANAPVSAHLFGQAASAEGTSGEGTTACVERLRARLGEAAVQVLGLRADYRPECATLERDPLRVLPPAGASTAELAAARPLWLLPEPQHLPERADGPHWSGPLQLLTRAERLESGWWDEGEAVGDTRRDYFVARNRQGQYAWIFRDVRGWFLHGLFA